MTLCAINLGHDISHLWFRSDDSIKKFFFISRFSKELGEGEREDPQARMAQRQVLHEAYLKFCENREDMALWREVARQQQDLDYYFSFLDHADQVPLEYFVDPRNPGRHVYFGESVFARQWSLSDLSAPIRRLREMGVVEKHPYFDKDLGVVTKHDEFLSDWHLVKALLKHLVEFSQCQKQSADEDSAGDSSQTPLRAVLGLPASCHPAVGAVFSALCLASGFDAVSLKAEGQLMSQHALGHSREPVLIIRITTANIELAFHPGQSRDSAGWHFALAGHNELVNAEIESRIQGAIRQMETGSEDLTFESISRDKLFFWKDAQLSPVWPEISKSDEYFEDFQYPYRLGDELTFRDVRAWLKQGLIKDASFKILESPLRQGLKTLVDKVGLESLKTSEGAVNVVMAGSGSQMEGAHEWVRQIIVSELFNGDSPSLNIHSVSQALDATVDGAMSLATAKSEETWESLTNLQQGWADLNFEEDRFDECLQAWQAGLSDALRAQMDCPKTWGPFRWTLAS